MYIHLLNLATRVGITINNQNCQEKHSKTRDQNPANENP